MKVRGEEGKSKVEPPAAVGGELTLPTPRNLGTAKAEVERKLPLILVALAQTITSVPPEKIDLTIPRPCETQKSNDDEIVVCARRNDGSSPYRVNQPMPQRSDIPKAEVQLADGVSLGAETENADVGGFSSNRLMARLKIKF